MFDMSANQGTSMRSLMFATALFALVSGGTAFAGDALCDKVKDAKRRATCHCATENGGIARTNEKGNTTWTGVSNRAAPALSACLQQRGV